MGRRHIAHLQRDELLSLPTRRALVAGSIALAALPLAAARRLPPPKVGAIRWPGARGDLHGFMAVPATAHGPQPAVLVLPNADADQFALGLTDALALAGFVACVAKTALPFEEAMATVRWLGTNRYATGKVGLVAMGAGVATARQMASAGADSVSCAVLFDGATGASEGTNLLHLPALAATTDATYYETTWQQAVAFLAAHLRGEIRSSRR
jgi:dienelactone hydrolase